MDRTNIDDLLYRYLNGQASPSEIQLVEAWINKNELMGTGWQRLDEPGKEQFLKDIFSAIETSTIINDPKIKPLWPKQNLWRKLAAIAAMFVLIFAAYITWPFLHDRLFSPQLSILKVPGSQLKQIVLDDGSVVTLNSGSELKYPKLFNRKTREVYLSGEAFFDIHHEPSRPFLIHSGRVLTTVLGTAFNIKEDEFKHTITVTVTRGKVSVANNAQILGIITPNQQISFNTINGSHSQKNVDSKIAVAWKESDIYFNNITFAAAVQQLQERFKVKIEFANEKLKNCRFTGTAVKGEKLDKILEIICVFNNATYQKKNDGSFVIDGAGCN